MKVVFIGASKFGLQCFKELMMIDNCEIVGVVTAPQNFIHSSHADQIHNVLHADFNSICKSFSISCEVIDQGMRSDDLFSTVQSWQPEAFIVVGWYHIIPQTWLKIAPAYGLHASLLPDYSGGAPLVWAIINGENKTGITLFQMGKGVDSGPIIGQETTHISNDDSIATVYARIEDMGVSLLRKYMPSLINHTAVLIHQDESKRRIFPLRSPSDGLINWRLSARQIYDFIRAQTRPYPGAYTFLNSEKIIIWATCINVLADLQRQPGELYSNDSKIFVTCGDGGVLEICNLSEANIDKDPQQWFKEKENENSTDRMRLG